MNDKTNSQGTKFQHLTIAVAIISLAISICSLGWQITNAIRDRMESVQMDLQVMRTANDGPVQLRCAVRNRGAHTVAFEDVLLRIFETSREGIYKPQTWSQSPNGKMIEPQRAAYFQMDFKNPQEFTAFMRTQGRMDVVVELESGNSVICDISQADRARTIGSISVAEPSANFTTTLASSR